MFASLVLVSPDGEAEVIWPRPVRFGQVADPAEQAVEDAVTVPPSGWISQGIAPPEGAAPRIPHVPAEVPRSEAPEARLPDAGLVPRAVAPVTVAERESVPAKATVVPPEVASPDALIAVAGTRGPVVPVVPAADPGAVGADPAKQVSGQIKATETPVRPISLEPVGTVIRSVPQEAADKLAGRVPSDTAPATEPIDGQIADRPDRRAGPVVEPRVAHPVSEGEVVQRPAQPATDTPAARPEAVGPTDAAPERPAASPEPADAAKPVLETPPSQSRSLHVSDRPETRERGLVSEVRPHAEPPPAASSPELRTAPQATRQQTPQPGSPAATQAAVEMMPAQKPATFRDAPVSREVGLSAEGLLGLHGGDGPESRTAATPQTRAETAVPRPVVSQLVQSITRSPADGVVEVRLQPEELGRVKLVVAPGETGHVVQIWAERAETLDLIRRNIDMLASDLRDRGFGRLDFTFGQDGRPAGGGAFGEPGPDPGKTCEAGGGLDAEVEFRSLPVHDGRLDIRV